MALTIAELLRALNPNIGLVQNPDGSFRIGIEDVNSDEILAALQVMSSPTAETPFTGAGNLVVATNKIAPGAAFKLVEIELTLSAAPTTAAQNLVITKDDGVGSAYDNVLLTLDLVANAITSLRQPFNITCKATDVITAAWTNTDLRTYGLIFKYQLV